MTKLIGAELGFESVDSGFLEDEEPPHEYTIGKL
jgi:hypothetical protein